VRLDYEYQSKNHTRTAAEDPSVSPTVYNPYSYSPPPTTFVSMRAGITVNKWSVSAFVDNLFDSHPIMPPSSYATSDVDTNANPGQGVLVRSFTFRPRTMGITSVYHF